MIEQSPADPPTGPGSRMRRHSGQPSPNVPGRMLSRMVRPKWAVATAAVALLAAPGARAVADSPDPSATPVPTVTPAPTPVPTVPPVATGLPGLPDPPTDGAWNVYVVTITTTITTTTTTAPITVIAAPVTTTTTTTTNNSSTNSSNSVASNTANGGTSTVPATGVRTQGKRATLNIDLRGCTRVRGRARSWARLRLARGTTLVVRVNGHRVGTLELDSSKAQTLPLRITLGRNGKLTVRRPSGRVLATQGCTAR
jgi:hypothetical protein